MMKNKKTMRVLHSAALLSPPSGILAQMNWEQDAANNLGLNWKVQMYCPINHLNKVGVLYYDDSVDAQSINSPIKKLLSWIMLRRNYHHWLLQQQDKFDIFILRYYVHDPFQLAFVYRCKKPVYLVHHTLEVPELSLPGGFKGFIRSKLENLLGSLTISRANAVIGVTQEIIDYELTRANQINKPAHIYPNGIVFEEFQLEDRRSHETPELLFVANFAPWHGLDILLKNITECQDNFILHLVGKIPDDLAPLTKDPRIKLHGPLNQQEIIKLSAQCWIGLSSFALFRNKMKQACPLKVREYLLLGLPVYGDYQDIFPAKNPYFRSGPAKINAIINFSKETRTLIKSDIASLARPFIDKTLLLKNLHNNIINKFFHP